MYTKARSVDIVIPVFNEEDCLEKNVLILYNYLIKVADFSWAIVIADNASNDATMSVAQELSTKYKQIHYLRLPKKGRGLALKKAFHCFRKKLRSLS